MIRSTSLCGQTDPWPLLVAHFPPGKTFRSRVENVDETIGAFVHVADKINGRVPRGQFAGAVPAVGTEVDVCVAWWLAGLRRGDQDDVQVGEEILVQVRHVDPARAKTLLREVPEEEPATA